MGIAFSSTRDYFGFISCREFVSSDSGNSFSYSKNTLEKIGEAMCKPIFGTADIGLRNIRNPLVITAITITIIAAITLVFYPGTFAALSTLAIQPWMVKFGFYLISQTTVLGVGLRGLGRLNNDAVAAAWNAKTIIPIPIGAERVR